MRDLIIVALSFGQGFRLQPTIAQELCELFFTDIYNGRHRRLSEKKVSVKN